MKIIGTTIGTTLPKPNFKQTDPTKGDYIRNKPVALTDEEIDAICGGALPLDITTNMFTDITTGSTYTVYVEDGKLSMKAVEGAIDTKSTHNTGLNIEKLTLVDTMTDIVHEVYISDGKLHMTEVE